ncbi:MAG: PAS domain-containing protein [Chloroflexi bacterium]|nr:PAS domain-containing protein [Chloroflexota bacterium]
MRGTTTCPSTMDPGSMFAAIAAGACLLDTGEFRVVAHNRAYQMLQREPYRSTGVVGLRLEEYVPEAEEAGLLKLLRRAASGEAVEVHDLPYHPDLHSERYWDVQVGPVRDLDGGIRWVLSMMSDVTDRVRRQRHLAELAASLRTVNGELVVSTLVAQEAEKRERAARQAADSQRLLSQAIIDNVPAAIAVLRAPGFTFELANRACQSIVPCGELVGKSVTEVWPELAPTVLPVAEQVLRTGEPSDAVSVRSRVQRGPEAQLEEAYFTFSSAPLRLAEGHTEALLVLGVETTENVRARKQVAELAEHAEASLRQLEAVVSGMADGLMIVDSKGRVVSMNPAALEMNGFESAEESRRHWRDLVDLFEVTYLDGRPVPIEDWPAARALRGETFRNVEIRSRRRDSGKTWVGSYGGAPVDDGSGDIMLAVITSQDVTGEKKTEEDQHFLAEVSRVLASSLDYEATLTNTARVAIPYLADLCAVDMLEEDGSIRRLTMTSACPGKDDLATELESNHWPNQSDRVGPANVLRTGEPELYSEVTDELLTVYARDPQHLEILRGLRFTSVMIVPLLTRGQVFGAIKFISAESGRHYGSADLALAQEVARRAAMSVDNARLYRDAQRAIRSRDEFLSVAAHELKTPVTSLRGFAQLTLRRLEKTHDDDPQLDRQRIHRALEVINQQSSKLSRLVSQLLDISRIEGGKLVLYREMTDVTALVQGVAAGARAMTHRHSIKVSVAPKVEALLDPLRFEQVVTNLIDNAIKYSPSGGEIDVELSKPESEMVRLVVRDRGFGIPPEHRHQIFGRFYQAHADSHTSGVGLGLHISHQIISLHGGELRVEFPDDGGTRFIVSVPTGRKDISGEDERSEQ